jgi:hypothetical protein
MANPLLRQVKSADPAIIGSALVVGGVWAYRKLVLPAGSTVTTGFSAASVAGLEAEPAAAAQFIPAFAFVYIVLALIGAAEPDAARSFAILVAVGDVLTNGTQIFSSVGAQASGATAAAAASTGTAAANNPALGPDAPSPQTVGKAVDETVTGAGVYVTPSGRLTNKTPSASSIPQLPAAARNATYNPSTGQYVVQ